MMTLAWAIFRGSRTLQAATAILAGWIAWNANNAYQRHQGATKVIVKSKEAGLAANVKNAKVRDRAREPGAAERLQRDACRDCK
jgi:hypothetical protein